MNGTDVFEYAPLKNLEDDEGKRGEMDVFYK